MSDRYKWPGWVGTTLREAAWAPLGVLIFYFVARSLQLFELAPGLDIPTHFLGGMVITYFYRVAIRRAQELSGPIPFPVQVVLAFTCSGTTTVLWEFYEYIFDLLFGTRMIRGVQDTIVDLFVGLMGALAVSLLYRRRH